MMESKLNKVKNNTRNVLALMQCRELNADAAKLLKQRTQFTESFVKRLGLEAELEGHQGCVNCLQWSPNGRHLASGSDDTNVILWDPFRHKQLEVIPTPHIGNIFSVKFLADENVITTAAGDCRVIVQSVNGAMAKSPPLLDCGCHLARVKRLATCPDQPTIFWSAGEDGFVLQFDMREPHECSGHASVLIDLYYKVEIKCIAVNPTQPHYLAIGANDCFVRLYDRRMMKLAGLNTNHLFHSAKRISPHPVNPECVQYYAPGHLAKENSEVYNVKLAVTYIAFNPAGSEMLVNIGGEQIYLFDVNKTRHVSEMLVPQYAPKKATVDYKNCCASYCFGGGNGFSVDTVQSNDCACFYMKRAFKSYQRKWVSDLYGASRDYLYVIHHWPDHIQAYVGLTKCMIALKWVDEGEAWLKHFLKIHPEQESSSQVHFLKEELQSVKTNTSTTESHEENIIKFVNDDEKKLRLESIDFERRYLGHCNTTTDIKEANFLGDNFVCAGSDEGIIFIWDKNTMEIVTALFGDNSIVNCIQPHPSACVIASSGIDPAVKIWSPVPEDGKANSKLVKSISSVVESNQHRMCMDPFESMLASMGYQIQNSNLEGIQEVTACRTN